MIQQRVLFRILTGFPIEPDGTAQTIVNKNEKYPASTIMPDTLYVNLAIIQQVRELPR